MASTATLMFLLSVALADGALDRLDRIVSATRNVTVMDTRLPAQVGILAPDRHAAQRETARSLRGYARSTSVELVSLEALPPSALPEKLQLQIRARGNQAQLMHFAEAIERDPRQLRFESWQLEGDGVDVRLLGIVRAVWRLR